MSKLNVEKFFTMTWHKHFLIRQASLIRFCDPTVTGSKFGRSLPLEETRKFIINYVMNHINVGVFLENLHDVYILVGDRSDEEVLREGEKSWKDILSDELFEKTKDCVYIPLAIALITKYEHYVAIESIDTFARGQGLCRFMIDKMDEDFALTCIPTDVTPNMTYWKKYVNDIEMSVEGVLEEHGVTVFVKGLDDLRTPEASEDESSDVE